MHALEPLEEVLPVRLASEVVVPVGMNLILLSQIQEALLHRVVPIVDACACHALTFVWRGVGVLYLLKTFSW